MSDQILDAKTLQTECEENLNRFFAHPYSTVNQFRLVHRILALFAEDPIPDCDEEDNVATALADWHDPEADKELRRRRISMIGWGMRVSEEEAEAYWTAHIIGSKKEAPPPPATPTEPAPAVQ